MSHVAAAVTTPKRAPGSTGLLSPVPPVAFHTPPRAKEDDNDNFLYTAATDADRSALESVAEAAAATNTAALLRDDGYRDGHHSAKRIVPKTLSTSPPRRGSTPRELTEEMMATGTLPAIPAAQPQQPSLQPRPLTPQQSAAAQKDELQAIAADPLAAVLTGASFATQDSSLPSPAPRPMPTSSSPTPLPEIPDADPEALQRLRSELLEQRRVLAAAAISIRRQQDALDVREADVSRREVAVASKERTQAVDGFGSTSLGASTTPGGAARTGDGSANMSHDNVDASVIAEAEANIRYQREQLKAVHVQLGVREEELLEVEDEAHRRERTLQRRESALEERESTLVKAEEAAVKDAETRAAALREAKNAAAEKTSNLEERERNIRDKERTLETLLHDVEVREQRCEEQMADLTSRRDELWSVVQKSHTLDERSRQLEGVASRLRAREDAVWNVASTVVRERAVAAAAAVGKGVAAKDLGASSRPLLGSLEEELVLLREHLHEARAGLMEAAEDEVVPKQTEQ